MAVTVLAVVAAASIWLISTATNDRDDQPSANSEDRGTIALRQLKVAGHTGDELGLVELVNRYIDAPTLDVRYRTFGDFERARNNRLDYLENEARGHERERLLFELRVESALDDAEEALPPELAQGGILDVAFREAMMQCAEESGLPRVDVGNISKAEVDSMIVAHDMTLDEFFDLRHECSKYAANYPTLDDSTRASLLSSLREHYAGSLADYLQGMPDSAIPLEFTEGDPLPHQEFLIELCLASPNPHECAEHNRVSLPNDTGIEED